MSSIQIEGDYELETGKIISETFAKLNYEHIPGVLVKNHGPFTWGANSEKAVLNSIVMEEIAKMAYAEFNCGGNILEASDKRPFTERLIPDASSLFDALGILPRISMKEGIGLLKRHCRPEKFGDLDVD